MTVREYVIGRFRLQPGRQLLADGAPVAVGARALDLLSVLVEAGGDLVTKDEVTARAWHGAIVEDNAIQAQITALRRILGPDAIATVRGRGYRFALGIAPEPAPEPSQPGKPPAALTRLIGREGTLQQLAALLAEHRLVTVVGTGGLGKTRIALQLGSDLLERFPDGVWMVGLEQLRAPEQVQEAILRMFGLRAQSGQTLLETVTAHLSRRAVLLILDNAEHLVGEVARIVHALLGRSAWTRIVVTSREVLGLPYERPFHLPPLGFPAATAGLTTAEALAYPAIQLLVERAGAARGGYTLTDQAASAVAEICRRLDGIALALELAGPRLRLLTPQGLLARLDDRFRLLVGGNRVAPPRQQTLEAAIDWSYDLLGEDERRVLRRLAVFAGSFTVDGATAVAAADPAEGERMLDALSALLDKSLVTPHAAAGPEQRYRLLESTRAYALAKLDAADRSACLGRLARHLAALFAVGEPLHETMATDDWLAVYGCELDNLRAALEWCLGPSGEAPLGITLAARTTGLWRDMYLEREHARWLGEAQSRIGAGTPPGDIGRIRLAAAPAIPGRRESLEPALEAAGLFRASGERMLEARALWLAGLALARPGDSAEAEAMLCRAEALLRPFGTSGVLSTVLAARASLRSYAGDTAGARRLGEASLVMARALGKHGLIQTLQVNLAELEFAEGRTEAAIGRAEEVRRACAEAEDPRLVAFAEAPDVLRAYRRDGDRRARAMVTQNLAGYCLAAGRVEPARAAAREALTLRIALGGYGRLVPCLEYLALIAAFDGDCARAARLAGYGDARHRAEGRSREPAEHAAWSSLQSWLAAGLPEVERDRLMAEGAGWSEAEAIAAALA